MRQPCTIAAVIAFIENRVECGFCAAELEKAVGLSISRIRSLMAHHMGRPLARYILERRIAHAAFSLLHEDRNVIDTALQYGFANHDGFTRAFRRLTGMNPSQFRKQRPAVGRSRLYGGIYGLSIKPERRDHMNQPLDGGMVLYGVPKVGYGIDGCTPYPICLKAVANYLGEDVDYAYILAMCGAAFRLTWDTLEWNLGNVDVCHTFDSYETVYRRGVEGLGREFSMLPRNGETRKQDFVDFIKTEIDQGRPCIATGIIGPPEACIITGYRNNGETLLGWNFFQDSPVFGSKRTEIDASGYFVSDDWWENEGTQSVMRMGDAVGAKCGVKGIVEGAIEVLSGRHGKRYAKGILAYDAWKASIENEGDFSENLPMMSERLMCQGDAMDCLADGRGNAAKYFQRLYQESPEQLTYRRIAGHFQQIATNVEEMAQILGGWHRGEKQMLALSKPENRSKISALIAACKAEDEMALEQLHILREQL